jgi:hypothetical protein
MTTFRLITMTDDAGTRWVWKAVKGQQDGNSEVAAYEIAKLLGMDCVPPTRYEEFEGELGTAQQFVDGMLGSEWVSQHGSQTPLDLLARSGAEDAVVLDFIIDNGDRHTGNWIVGERGWKLWAIDNGGIFGQDLKYYRNVYHKYLFRNNFPFHSSLFDLLHSFKLEDFEAILKPLYGDSRFAEDCMARTRWIIRHRRHLAFKIVSEGHFDKNDFPSHKEELDALRHTRGLVADEGVFGASDAA